MMNPFVCLFRGVNVGGHRRVSMAELRELLGCLGMGDVKSYLQSGNLVFRSSDTGQKVERALDSAIHARFGFDAKSFLFSARSFRSLIGANPFALDSNYDQRFQHVTLIQRLAFEWDDGREYPMKEGEQLAYSGGHCFLYCPSGYGRTKLHNAYIERLVGSPATTRSWKTILALGAMIDSVESR